MDGPSFPNLRRILELQKLEREAKGRRAVRRRPMDPAARGRVSEAQKRRWEEFRRQKLLAQVTRPSASPSEPLVDEAAQLHALF